MRFSGMQFLAMLLLCFMGTWTFSGLDSSWRLMEKTIETYYEESDLADFWVYASSFSRQDLNRLSHMDGIAEIQPRASIEADFDNTASGITAAIDCFEGPARLNVPYLKEGSRLTDGDTRGCLMEEQFAAALGKKPGDRIRLVIAGSEVNFTVRGLVLSPEYTITSKDVAPDPGHYGFIIVSKAALPILPYTNVLIRLEEGADADAVRQEIEASLPSAMVITQETHRSTSTCRSYPQMFKGMAILFPVLVFAVAAMIVVSTLTRMIAAHRMQIGTLKSLGYHPDQIRRHYVWYALVPSVIGSVCGLFVGHISIPPVLWAMIAHNARFPKVLFADISPISILMTGFSILLSVVICMITLRRSLQESTAELLRPKPPASGTRILLEHWKGLWKRFSFNRKMVIRNLMRNKGRTAIILVGIICCNMLIIATFGLQESITYFIGEYYGGTLQYEMKAELKSGQAGTLESYQKRLHADRIEGIMDISVSLHTGDSARTCLLTVLRDKQTSIRLAGDKSVLPLPDEGLVISRKLAKTLNIELGEKVEIVLSGDDEKIYLPVLTFADTNAGQQLFMSESAWKKCRKGDFIPTALLIDGPTEETLHELIEMDEVDTIRRVSEQFEQTVSILDAARAAFSILSGAALALAFIICYNMGLMNFTERTRDYATLKVLGYHQREIRGLMLHESCDTSLLGVVLGIPPGIALVDIILRMCEFDAMVFESNVSVQSVALACVITFLFTLLIEGLLTRKVRGIDMVEALKSVE